MLNPKLIKRLEKFLKDEDMLGKPATAEQITKVEAVLKMKLPEDYVDFITRFGGTYAGIAIHAIESSKHIGKETVIELTNAMRESIDADDDRYTEAQQSLAFSDDGSGNPFVINPAGEVVIYYHDSDEVEILAPSLSQFIEDNFEEW